jgi:quinol-cytochrome oxidoreductase complex cytochrome b subunit
VGTEVAGAVPVMGDFVLRFLRGGPHVTGGTLTRFYGIHVAVLPAITTAVMGVHLYLVQRHGMSVPPGMTPRRSMPFLPNFLLRDCIGWCLALACLAALAAFLPWELGEKADPFAPAPAGIRPEWYFAWMFQLLKLLPAHILGIEGELVGILGISLAALLWVFVPFLDRAPERGGLTSRLWIAAGWGAVAVMGFLTAIVYLRPGG